MTRFQLSHTNFSKYENFFFTCNLDLCDWSNIDLPFLDAGSYDVCDFLKLSSYLMLNMLQCYESQPTECHFDSHSKQRMCMVVPLNETDFFNMPFVVKRRELGGNGDMKTGVTRFHFLYQH